MMSASWSDALLGVIMGNVVVSTYTPWSATSERKTSTFNSDPFDKPTNVSQ